MSGGYLDCWDSSINLISEH